MEENTSGSHPCKGCGTQLNGKYCAECGQSAHTKRITLGGLVHEVFHFFTHLEKGFGFTLKQLVVAPGTMQRTYIEGVRGKYQKPISMFLLCATINALCKYWIYAILFKYYHSGNEVETSFIHQYMVLLYFFMLPVVALVTWLFFLKAGYNYAETGVMQLYNFSFIVILFIPIALMKLIWPSLDTAYVELPLLLSYTAITFIRFYNNFNPWITLIKSVAAMTIVFLLAQVVEDTGISLLGSFQSHH